MTESIIANLYWLSELTLYEKIFRLGSVVVSPTLHVPNGSMSASSSPSHESTVPLKRLLPIPLFALTERVAMGPLSWLTDFGSLAVLWCALGGLYFQYFEDVNSDGVLVVIPNGGEFLSLTVLCRIYNGLYG